MTSTYVPAIKIESRGIIYHTLLSISFSTPIILSSAIDKVFFDKSKLPYLPPKDIVSLCILTTITTFTIDYLQSHNYMPQILKYQ